MIGPYISTCKYCGKRITWSGLFGWVHNEIDSVWNTWSTSCEDDANKAEPKGEDK